MQSIEPGSFVTFVCWSTYLAEAVSSSGHDTAWHELWPGDRGLVIYVSSITDVIYVLFSRVGLVLKVRTKQVCVIELADGNIHLTSDENRGPLILPSHVNT